MYIYIYIYIYVYIYIYIPGWPVSREPASSVMELAVDLRPPNPPKGDPNKKQHVQVT